MTQLFPDVKDVGHVGSKPSLPYAYPIGIEGAGASDGTAVANTVYEIDTPSQADTLFGSDSTLSEIVKFVLGRGVTPVWAVASLMAPGPTLQQRQAAWAVLEAMPNIRIRLTDDVAQATLVALATSCNNANLIFHKQIGFGGLASGSTKAQLMAAAVACNNNRFALVGPGVIDSSGTLNSGAHAAAVVAAAVAQNADLSDGLNLDLLFNLAGIEEDANGQPLFLKRVVSGTVVNDFEDLLQSGVSPLMTDESGSGVRITHIRTTYVGSNPSSPDLTYDALMTRLILDAAFLAVKSYCVDNNFFRKGNTEDTREAMAIGIEGVLDDQFGNVITPIILPDGTTAYGVTVIPSSDLRSVTIQYQGTIVRDIGIINIDEELTIPV